MPKRNAQDVDLGLLRVLDALLAEGSVTRASRRVRLTQPAVSKALSKLRAAFSDPLFVRTAKGLIPTARARALQLPVQRLLSDARSLTSPEAWKPATETGVYTLAATEAEAMLISPLVRAVALAAPKASVRIRRVPEDTVRALESFGCDAVIRPSIPEAPAVRRKRLYTTGWVVVARTGHPLLQRGLTHDAYFRAGHVFVSLGEPGAKSLVSETVNRLGLERRIAVTVAGFFEAGVVAAETDVLFTAPAHFARAMAQRLPVKLYELPIEVPPIDIYVYWHEARDADPRQKWLRELLFDAGARLTA